MRIFHLFKDKVLVKTFYAKDDYQGYKKALKEAKQLNYINFSIVKDILENPSNPTTPCPQCGHSCILIPSQNTKLCVGCGWKNEEWIKETDQPTLYGN